VGFVVEWCFPKPIGGYLDKALAGFVTGIVVEFVVVLKPTALVATSVMMCLWQDRVGGTVDDVEGGRSLGCSQSARVWSAVAMICGSGRRGERWCCSAEEVSSSKQGVEVDDESEVESRFELMLQHTRHRGSVVLDRSQRRGGMRCAKRCMANQLESD